MNAENKKFYDQIREDINLIQRDYIDLDVTNMPKEEFAFNYWILSRLYNMDEDVIKQESCITEYNDKGIDCFASFPETKELFIIQNKFYDPDSNLKAKEVSDFLERPLASLLAGKYKKSKNLQDIFNDAIKDSEYKIYLYFYTTSEKGSTDIDSLLKNFTYDKEKIEACVYTKVFFLGNIKETYYDDRHKEVTKFIGRLETRVKGTMLRIRPKEKEYNLGWMLPSWFVLANVVDLYFLYKNALAKKYELFEDNVREFLGRNSINNQIIRTLEEEERRGNFFYYNNGVTLICEECIEGGSGSARGDNRISLELKRPQVVNGCQTMNSIYEVLYRSDDGDEGRLRETYKKSYVLVKIYVFTEEEKEEKGDKWKKLYDEIVKYTNSQNSIKEKDFASKRDYFLNIQKEFSKRGILLMVKPSDKETFKSVYSDSKKFRELKERCKKTFPLFKFGGKIEDHTISLEKLLKVLLAFKYDAWHAYTRGKYVLKKNSSCYNDFSMKIADLLNYDNMINLYLLYHKVEIDQKKKKNPIPPYYVADFLARKYCEEEPIVRKEEDPVALNGKLSELFKSEELFKEVYNFYCSVVEEYTVGSLEASEVGYNQMIKARINDNLVKRSYATAIRYLKDNAVKKFLGIE